MDTTTFTFERLETALDSFIRDFIGTYKSILLRDGKKATGNLVASLKPVSIQLKNNRYEVGISIASYWKYVEYGRKPGKWPPRDKILEWIKVKPVIPRPNNGAKLPTQEQLAFLISRKIGRDGIEPGNQFEEALRLVWSRWEDRISNAISSDLDEQLELVTLGLTK